MSCGLCDIMSSCTGCLIKNVEEFQVKPGLCITVHFNEISAHLYNRVSETSYYVVKATFLSKGFANAPSAMSFIFCHERQNLAT